MALLAALPTHFSAGGRGGDRVGGRRRIGRRRIGRREAEGSPVKGVCEVENQEQLKKFRRLG